MNTQVIDQFIDYVLSDLLKVIHDNVGGASQSRCYLVGRGLLGHIAAKLEGLEMTEAIKKTLSFIKEARIVDNAEASLNESILELHFHNCRFLPVMEEIKRAKIPAFICPCTNVCLELLESKFNVDTEIISINCEGDTCKVKVYLFK